MRLETRSYLADARAAAEEILQISDSGRATGRVEALAIERLFEIIGEALVRVRGMEPEILDSITDAGAIIGMRNFIAHGYDSIDAERIAATIRERLPALIGELNTLID